MKTTLIILLLPLFSYSQDTAKYCFTPKEMDFWIGQTIDCKTEDGFKPDETDRGCYA